MFQGRRKGKEKKKMREKEREQSIDLGKRPLSLNETEKDIEILRLID